MRISPRIALLAAASMAMTGLAGVPASGAPSGTSSDSGGTAATPQKADKDLSTFVFGEGTEARDYLVRLASPPAALQAALAAAGTADDAAVGRDERRFERESPANDRRIEALKQEQNEVAGAKAQDVLGRRLKITARYTIANNGFVARMTPAEARQLALLPEVTYIREDYITELHTDRGPAWINAASNTTPDPVGTDSEAAGLWDWDGADFTGNGGEGVVVGVIDTGINPLNPSFAEVGPVDGHVHPAPAKYYGVCDPDRDFATDPDNPDAKPYDDTFPCNDKLIGAWGYYSVDDQNGVDYGPYDYDGHGSHTASTAAGNILNGIQAEAPAYTPDGVTDQTFDISGVAPHAQIIMYAGCCTFSGLVSAIDQVVSDGVDVVNYSIGSSSPSNPWFDFDTFGFLVARFVGIQVATSEGNAGPNPATVGGPADAPWLTAVAATTHDRANLNSLENLADDDAGTTEPGDFLGKGVTPGLGTSPIVYAGDFDGNALCAPGVWAPGTFTDEIVVCDRGTYGRVEKSFAVADAGGAGYVLLNDAASGDSLNGDSFAIPGVHLTYDQGLELKAWMAAADNPTAEISGVDFDVVAGNGDIMAAFSSRGPNGAIDVLTPSVAAPGVDILAAAGVNADEVYEFISGTSMASPHVAGALALMANEHPDWSAAEIQSALMTTAVTNVLKEDGTTPADPYDMGNGRVDLIAAAAAGLVFTETVFGDEDPTDPQQVGYWEADPAIGGDPTQLNTPSIMDTTCVVICEFTRVVTAPADLGPSVTWTVSATMENGVGIDVDVVGEAGDTFELAPGESQQLDITIDVGGQTLGETHFGQILLESSVGSVPDAHLPVAAALSASDLPDLIEIDTWDSTGGTTVPVTSVAATDLQVEAAGLTPGVGHALVLSEDPTNGDPFDNVNDGTVDVQLIDVPADTARLVAQVVASGAPDVDLYVGPDLDGEGDADPEELWCMSATGSALEYCDVHDPDAGTWWVLTQNWDDDGDGADEIDLVTAVVPNVLQDNLEVTSPATATEGVPWDLSLVWENLMGEAYWYGRVTLGTDAGNPDLLGTASIDLRVRASDREFTWMPLVGRTGEAVEFVVDPATSLQDDILMLSWDFDADGVEDATGTTAEYTFDTPGVHDVTLTLTDPEGDSRTVQHSVTVQDNQAPVAEAGEDREAGVDQEITLVGFGADPEGDPVTYEWDFGDGSDPESGRTVTLAWDTAGTYTVTLTVTDDRGASSTDTLTVTVVPEPVDQVDRASGKDRIETAILMSERSFDAADTVLIARADQFPDALAASALAAEVDGPILLNPSDELDDRVLAELERLGASKAYLIGGTAALAAEVETDLEDAGLAIERLAGLNRFATAAAVSDEVVDLGGRTQQVIIALGQHPDPNRDAWPDALAAGSLATTGRAPILLVTPTDVPLETRAALSRVLATGGKVWIAGGTAAVGADVQTSLAASHTVTRLSGADRYATALAIVQEAVAQGASLEPTFVASGRNYPDALAAAPAAWKAGGVLLLVDPVDLANSEVIRSFLISHDEDIATLVIAGGPLAVSDDVRDQLHDAITEQP